MPIRPIGGQPGVMGMVSITAANYGGIPTTPHGNGSTAGRGKPAASHATKADTPATTLSLSAQAASSMQTLAAPKDFATVAKDARNSMDTQYAAMKDSGQPFDYNSWEGKDWDTLFSGLDRRSIYAVRSNEGGQFTKQEQDMAQSFMVREQGLAMGLYSGPTSKEGDFVDPFTNDADRFKAGMRFLDGVSAEEKSSVEWAAARASAQIAYESTVRRDGKTPEKADSGSPLVRLIMAAMETMKDDRSRATSSGRIDTADDLKRQPWFNGFQVQLDQLMGQQRLDVTV